MCTTEVMWVLSTDIPPLSLRQSYMSSETGLSYGAAESSSCASGIRVTCQRHSLHSLLQIYHLYLEAFVKFSEAGPISTIADEARFAHLLTTMIQHHAHVINVLARSVPTVRRMHGDGCHKSTSLRIPTVSLCTYH